MLSAQFGMFHCTITNKPIETKYNYATFYFYFLIFEKLKCEKVKVLLRVLNQCRKSYILKAIHKKANVKWSLKKCNRIKWIYT